MTILLFALLFCLVWYLVQRFAPASWSCDEPLNFEESASSYTDDE